LITSILLRIFVKNIYNIFIYDAIIFRIDHGSILNYNHIKISMNVY
jgi:hypothetical protein